MALLVPSASVSMDVSTGAEAPQVTGLYAGQDLLAAAPCYIKTADGMAYMSDGTAANEAAEFVGFTPRACKQGEPVTLFGLGTRFRYADTGLAPGDRYYIAATPGRLDTVATVGDAVGVAQALSTTDIRITRNV